MFSHRKPHINVGTIGHADHDETTLTAAIIKALGRKLGSTITIYDEIDNSPKEKVYGITISTAHVEYETAAHHYSQVDFSSHGDYIKKILSGPVQIDIAIPVVSATGGRMPQTREQILLARQAGVPDIVVFLNKCDMVDVLDMYIRAPVQAVSHPFLMLVEDVLYVTGRGTVATGRVERGMILVGDEVEVVGFGATVWTTCAGMKAFRKKLDVASANEIVGILLRDPKREDVGRGHVLAMPGTTGIYANFRAEVYVRRKDESGRHTSFTHYYWPQFYFHVADVTGSISLLEGREMVMPGDNLSIAVKLIALIVMEVGLHFAIRESDG